LTDVAARAGVSLKTASRAINGERHVSAETAVRVLAAAEDLGFLPNRLAQGLRSGSALASVGLVIGDLGNPFWSSVARGVERELARADLLLITASHEEDAALQRRLLRALVERRVDGLLLVPAPGDDDLEALLRGVPVVAIDRPLAAPTLDEVLFEDRGGAATAVAALAAGGHRRIAFVGAETSLWTVQERLAGYRQSLDAAGLEADPRLVRLDCRDPAAAASATRDLLRIDAPPTAVLAMNNVISRGIRRAVHDAGAALDIMAFDPDPDAELFTPSPSTVMIDPEAAGRAAAAILLDRLGGDRRPVRRVVLPAALVIRPRRARLDGVDTAAQSASAATATATATATAAQTPPRPASTRQFPQDGCHEPAHPAAGAAAAEPVRPLLPRRRTHRGAARWGRRAEAPRGVAGVDDHPRVRGRRPVAAARRHTAARSGRGRSQGMAGPRARRPLRR
jgi:LacI family transcriptional regulator